MEANPYIPATLLDLVFENRNKAYGAYQLRRQYPNHVLKATILGIITVGLFLWGCSYLQKLPAPAVSEVNPDTKDVPVIQLADEDLFLEKVLPPPPAPEPRNLVQTPVRTPSSGIKIVSDVTPITKATLLFNNEALTDPAPDDLPGAWGPGTEEIVSEVGESGNLVLGPENEPFTYVEKMPEYREGGQAGLYKFINLHLRYPRLAQDQGLEGTVIVSFVISPAGEATNLQVLKDLGGGTGEEALRVLALMPQWKPGFQNQRAVPVRMTLPIRFKLH